MRRKPNTPLSNVATSSSPNNLNWENAKHACLGIKYFTKLLLPVEIMQELAVGRQSVHQEIKNQNKTTIAKEFSKGHFYATTKNRCKL